MPNTSSPGRKAVTSLPTVSITPGDVLTSHPLLGRPPSGDEADRVRRTGHDVPVADERTRRDDTDQNLPATRDRRLDVLEPQYVGRAVLVLDDRLHAVPLPERDRQ
jgi:hypothetical protein